MRSKEKSFFEYVITEIPSTKMQISKGIGVSYKSIYLMVKRFSLSGLLTKKLRLTPKGLKYYKDLNKKDLLRDIAILFGEKSTIIRLKTEPQGVRKR